MSKDNDIAEVREAIAQRIHDLHAKHGDEVLNALFDELDELVDITGYLDSHRWVSLNFDGWMSGSPEDAAEAKAGRDQDGSRHELKTWPQFFEELRCGRKTFEVRRSDRPFAVGDTLVLREFDPESGCTGRKLARKVSYIMGESSTFGFKGWVVMGLQREEQQEDTTPAWSYDYHYRWLVTTPYRNGAFRGMEKCMSTKDGSPVLYESKADAQAVIDKTLSSLRCVPCLLVAPRVGQSVLEPDGLELEMAKAAGVRCDPAPDVTVDERGHGSGYSITLAAPMTYAKAVRLSWALSDAHHERDEPATVDHPASTRATPGNPCKGCGATSGNTLCEGWYRCNKCGYPGK